jgi:flagellar biosynthesis/type III secretory pathway M-ring protein FliF/YscJ
MARANSVGFVLLALLIIFATYSDVMRMREEHAARKAQAAEAAP